MTAIAEAGRPLIISATDHPVDLIPAAARRSRVAGWSVVRDHQGAVGGEGEAVRIAQPDRPDGVAGAERVVARKRAVGVVAEVLAADARSGLRLVLLGVPALGGGGVGRESRRGLRGWGSSRGGCGRGRA